MQLQIAIFLAIHAALFRLIIVLFLSVVEYVIQTENLQAMWTISTVYFQRVPELCYRHRIVK